MRCLISRRYYPTYHGRANTTYSYRSYVVGTPDDVRRGTADVIVARDIPDHIPSGWVCATGRAHPVRSLRVAMGIINAAINQ